MKICSAWIIKLYVILVKGRSKQTEYLMFFFVNADERLKTLPRCKSLFLSNFVYIRLLLVSRPIVLKSWYLTERNAVWESLVICKACHHEGFLKFGNSASALQKPAAEERAQCSTSFKSLHNFTKKWCLGRNILETQHFLFFSHFSFFLFKLQSLRRLGIYVNNQFVILRKKNQNRPKICADQFSWHSSIF